MSKWTLRATCEAESLGEAAAKFLDCLPYMLANDDPQHGGVTVEISEDEDKPA